MRAERVGRADHRIGGNQSERAVGDVVMRGHVRGGRLKRLPARHMPPPGDRPQAVVPDERCQDDRGRHPERPT